MIVRIGTFFCHEDAEFKVEVKKEVAHKLLEVIHIPHKVMIDMHILLGFIYLIVYNLYEVKLLEGVQVLHEPWLTLQCPVIVIKYELTKTSS